MVAEQAAVTGRSGVIAARGRAQLRDSISHRPAVAGREMLGKLLGQSVLVRLMLALTFIALAGLIYLAQASQVNVLHYQLSSLSNEQVAAMAQNANLAAAANNLQSLKRIDEAAT